jgi:Zn-dependent protease
VPEGIAVGLFVAGLQSLFFQMIPIKFMDGRRIFEWNKVAWVGMAAVTAFLFWHVFINEGAAADEAISAGDPMTVLILLTVCLGLTVLLYGFFWLRHARAGHPA